ncbi:MAG: phenylalanine--tRNA ligase subunit alpha [Methanobrevibacter arboriphilus]|uniref:Phenylalanine--tRNA ligase alpha subunit n=1 Tax=Methanobrevibacter arboriphilus TaxID=39441 RepID=A0A843AE09_METAZ|nr:phenylalanine--tRNA ligase subunit alpha [Methanobrevibacter arboriphilus]MBF4469667.1 phenylalanine--tRNA ligase subunit alpha [Methanobrevibacter arboriphilus]
MCEDITKIIDELHIYEKKLLKSLKENENYTPEEIAKINSMDIKSVMSAAGSLASKDIIEVEKSVTESIKLTDVGKKYAEIGLPERRVLNVLIDEKELSMKDLATSTGIENYEIKIVIGWLVRKKWAKIDKGTVKLTDFGAEFKDKKGNDELLLKYLLKSIDSVVSISDFDEDLLEGLKQLNDRKNLIEVEKQTEHSFKILEKGLKILNRGITIQEEATQLTSEQIKTGEWKNLKYRPYDINAEYPEVFPGKGHPLRMIIEEIREIFLNLGFSESNGCILESAFWNFDSLFQPQDHAAREMQDTFYVKNPISCNLPDEVLVESVAKTHENGGNTGSEGWNYNWSKEVAEQSVLRTHTTGISTRFLEENKPPLKMFSVGRVFRRETITYKHLPEFHQVEGIVAADGISYQNLLGTLKEFYKKLGFEVRFRPAYFPYTYLSTECEVYLEEKESWIELGGSGMFRPEVLEPLGIDVPVLAFGLGIERLAMIRYDISDIRMLYKSDIKWLREIPVDNGIKLD